jgi:hypothetical protein
MAVIATVAAVYTLAYNYGFGTKSMTMRASVFHKLISLKDYEVTRQTID